MVVLSRPEEAYSTLPRNYNFELSKTIRCIKRLRPARVALQFPDGLLKYALKIKTILSSYAQVFVLGDAVYGACCIDDGSASELGCGLLVHYGHSCLIDVSLMKTKVLYVFVDIKFDTGHLVNLVKEHFRGKKVALFGTIQYNSAVHAVKKELERCASMQGTACTADGDESPVKVFVPQAKPLSPGEVIGCTSPRVRNADCGIYIGDGRFHLEAFMIANPSVACYKYCPFTKKMTSEEYVPRERSTAVVGTVGVIQSTLGRQGNPMIVESLVRRLRSCYMLVVNELSEEILDRFEFIDTFVQVGCPRLSIDWCGSYRKPLLTPFDVLGGGGDHPMDYYASGEAPWKN